VNEPAEKRTEAAFRRSRWPGWIWAVPIAAFIIVGWLGLRGIMNRGPEVTVTFASASGIKAGDTQVRYRGLDVGAVEDVRLAKDLSHVVVTLRLDRKFDHALTEGTRFWIVGGNIGLENLAALRTIVSGPYIAIDPGPGKPTHHFTGLEQAAPVAAETAGTRFVLHAHELDSLKQGATVKYLGLDVGVVETDRLVDQGHGFDIDVFIRAPFDKLVHAGTRFWNAGAVRISTGDGLSAQLVSLTAIVSGAIAFETLPGGESGPTAKSDDRFELYDSEQDAVGAPIGQTISYRVQFGGAVGDLRPGAPVMLRGFRVGEVTAVDFAYDARKDRLETPVKIELEPARLKLDGASPEANGDWTPAVSQALDQMIRQGLRARLGRTAPVIGRRIVSLDFVAGASPAHLILGGQEPEIPAAASGDIAGLTAQAGAIMSKIDAVPFVAIGDDLRHVAGQVKGITASPALQQSLDHIERASAALDRTLRIVNSRAGPVLKSVDEAASEAQQAAASANTVLGGAQAEQDRDVPHALHELAGAARSIRALADYLDRHPEALLEGKAGSSQ
jgi:paraquat-inducible protein B